MIKFDDVRMRTKLSRVLRVPLVLPKFVVLVNRCFLLIHRVGYIFLILHSRSLLAHML